MPKVYAVTLRSRWLGTMLRQLREQNKMTLAHAGEYLQRDPGMISRFENGISPIRRGDVLALIDLYGVSDQHTRTKLIKLSEEIWRKGWWDAYTEVTDQQFIDYTWLETQCERVRTYEAMYVPGLAQTRPYAEAMIRNAEAASTPEESVIGWVEFRMDRQKAFDGAEPKQLSAVVEESVLRRPVGGPRVLYDQLQLLLELGRRDTVDLRIMMTAVGAHAGMDGAFTIFDMPDPYPDVAYAESLAGRLFVESPAAERFSGAYDRLQEASLDPDESTALIASIMKELR